MSRTGAIFAAGPGLDAPLATLVHFENGPVRWAVGVLADGTSVRVRADSCWGCADGVATGRCAQTAHTLCRNCARRYGSAVVAMDEPAPPTVPQMPAGDAAAGDAGPAANDQVAR